MSELKVGYARVSADAQDLAAQRDALEALGVEPSASTSTTASPARTATGRARARRSRANGASRRAWQTWTTSPCSPRWPSGVRHPVLAPRPSLYAIAHERVLRPLGLVDVERANRRLAAALGADAGAMTNAATIMRPPGTHNFKTGAIVSVLQRVALLRSTVSGS